MSLSEVYQQFFEDIKHTTLLEYLAVFSGIASVWYSRKESILVYPVGLISTVIYVYISFMASLFGEAGVHFYYTVMSIYGWVLWTKKDKQKHHIVIITTSNNKEWMHQLSFFVFLLYTHFFSAYLS